MSVLCAFLVLWRDKLCNELSTDASGFLGRKYIALACAIPDTFPDLVVILLYTNPITSWSTGGERPEIPVWQPRQPNIAGLATFCERSFDWGTSSGIPIKFRNHVWEGACIRQLSSVWFDILEMTGQ
jgi:Holliday junction resolvase YEN1